MNKFFYYYNPACTGANTPTVFANDPYVIEIKKMFLIELQQLVYYIQKLKSFDIDMSLYANKVIEFIYVLIVNLDFKKENFNIIMEDLYNNKLSLKSLYFEQCEINNIEKEPLKDSSDNIFDINNEIKNINLQDNTDKLSQNKKSLYEIMINLILNACSFLIELKNYKKITDEETNEVLNLLNTTNFPNITEEELISRINDFSAYNYKITKNLYNAIKDKYGEITKETAPIRIESGKAILVSGHSYTEFEKILQQVKDTDIKVYTHNGMINAFAMKELRKYPNLTGHYQYEGNNYSKDFANFPGPIYITDNLIPKTDIIKGQIYTSAKYPSFGIGKIINNDFSPLIKNANNTKGFETTTQTGEISVGYNKSEFLENIRYISEKINNNEIERIIIIGQCDDFRYNNEYIENFIKSINNNDYIINFSTENKNDNIWSPNTSYNFPLLYKIIETMKSDNKNICKKISVFLTDCNTDTISHIFNLKQLGIKKIFLGQCCPNIVNPMLINGLYELFNIEQLSKPELDLNKI